MIYGVQYKNKMWSRLFKNIKIFKMARPSIKSSMASLLSGESVNCKVHMPYLWASDALCEKYW